MNDPRMTPGRVQPISEILSELMARRGYARVLSNELLTDAWQRAAGETLSKYTRAGNLRRGALEITVANSTLMQELTYQKSNLLQRLDQLLPHQSIQDLRFKVGPVL